jgi:hypothetical protein
MLLTPYGFSGRTAVHLDGPVVTRRVWKRFGPAMQRVIEGFLKAPFTLSA